jgi:hypothetical protein
VGVTCTNWLNSIELGTGGRPCYLNGRGTYFYLIDAGISLTDAHDELRWTGGDGTGIFNHKECIQCIGSRVMAEE